MVRLTCQPDRVVPKVVRLKPDQPDQWLPPCNIAVRSVNKVVRSVNIVVRSVTIVVRSVNIVSTVC